MRIVEWMKQASCRGEDTSIFFPSEDEKAFDRKVREAKAKAICANCPVQRQCLIAGDEEEGIWGGLTEAERSGKHRRRKLLRPIVHNVEANQDDANPWIAIDQEGGCQIWQRESTESWHGVEWGVVKNGKIVYISTNLDDTYAKYGSLLYS